MSKKNVAIIFGGQSSEHEVSRKSAVCIINNICKEKYNVYIIGINKEGKWFLYNGPSKNILNGSWENPEYTKPSYITPDPTVCGIIVAFKDEVTIIKIDVIIPVLHGKNGEDGTMQGLLEMSGIPYVGSNTLASAMCMDKITANIMCSYYNIDQAKFLWFTKYQFTNNMKKYVDEIESEIGYPVFVKPSNSGSSVGVGKAFNRNQLIEHIVTASKEDDRILIEEAIIGKEVECAILGNDSLKASVIGEISTKDGFYDYNSKYLNNQTELFIPARIDDEISKKIQEISREVYSVMGCSGLSRIDFFVEEKSGKIYLNEINTFPGFTNISMYPMLMDKSGISTSELIDELLSLAFEKEGCFDE